MLCCGSNRRTGHSSCIDSNKISVERTTTEFTNYRVIETKTMILILPRMSYNRESTLYLVRFQHPQVTKSHKVLKQLGINTKNQAHYRRPTS